MPVVSNFLFTTLATAGVAVGAAETIALVTTRLLTTVAATALQSALQKKPRTPGLQTTFTQTGGVNPQSFVIGNSATAGTFVAPRMSHGKVTGAAYKRYLNYVLDMGDIPGSTMQGLILDGQRVEIGAANHPSAHPDYGRPILGDYEGFAWVKTYDGTQTQADPMLVAKYPPPHVRPWTSSMVLTGVPYAIFTFSYKRRVWQSGWPTLTMEVSSIPLFDPRDGTTGPSSNIAVQIYNVLRGITLPDGSVWGGGYEPWQLPDANWIAAANECDVLRELPGGGTEPQYRGALEIRVSDEPAEIIEELLKGCNGRITALANGQFKIRCGAPPLPVWFITDDDILVSRSQEMEPFPGLAATKNAIHATYPDPEHLWESTEAPARYNPEWEAEDGGRRLLAELSLPAVPYPLQVQQTMKASIEAERRFRRHSFTLPPDASALEPLDVISWTSARNGYVDKYFEIHEVAEDVRRAQPTLMVLEVDPDDYNFTLADQLPTAAAAAGKDLPAAQAVEGWGLSRTTVKDAGGTDRREALEMVWDAAAAEDARGLRWQIRIAGTTEVILRGSTQDFEAGKWVVKEGILPDTTYEARAELIVDRATSWSAWAQATTGGVRLGRADIVQALQDEWDAGVAQAAEARALHDVAVADAEGTIAELRDLLGAAYGPLTDVRVPLAEVVAPLVPRQRAVEDVVDEMAMQVSFGLQQAQQIGQRMADAGIHLNPGTGQIEIRAMARLEAAVNTVSIELDAQQAAIGLRATHAEMDAAISAAQLDPTYVPLLDDLDLRVTTAELTLDALEGTVGAKAETLTVDGIDARLVTAEAEIDSLNAEFAVQVTRAEMDAAETRLGTVEFQMSAMDAPSIAQTVIDTRRQYDALDVAAMDSLAALWSAYSERPARREAIAFATSELSARVNDDLSAEASAREALGVQLGDVVASVEVERLARIDADGVLSGQITTVQASIGDIDAAIVTEQQARADGDSALASQITTVQAEVDDNAAAVAVEATARAAADSSLASQITTIAAEAGDNAAAIASLSATRVTASGAVAAVESQISASFASLTAFASAGAFAKVQADRINAGFIWRLGTTNVMELVRIDTGTSGAKVTARIAADHIFLDGTTTMGTAFLDKVFASTAVIGRLVVTDKLIAPGAVSVAEHEFLQEYAGTDDADFVVCNTTDYINVKWLDPMVVEDGHAVKLTVSCNLDAPEGEVTGLLRFERRHKTSGTWGAWSGVRYCDTGKLVDSVSTTGTMVPFHHSTIDKQYVGPDVQYRLMIRRQPASAARKIRMCRIYVGAEQIKR